MSSSHLVGSSRCDYDLSFATIGAPPCDATTSGLSPSHLGRGSHIWDVASWPSHVGSHPVNHWFLYVLSSFHALIWSLPLWFWALDFLEVVLQIYNCDQQWHRTPDRWRHRYNDGEGSRMRWSIFIFIFACIQVCKIGLGRWVSAKPVKFG